ncbi:MAG: aspartate 1-decarboxylase [Acidimicrobiia bacterium]
MQRTMMKSKIHRATVTGANVDYVGSISLDPDLMRAADIMEFEQVHVVDINNGSRLVTYAIVGAPGEVCLNGAAAHLVDVGDLVIVISYSAYDATELLAYEPRIVQVDTANHAVDEATAKRLAGQRLYETIDA